MSKIFEAMDKIRRQREQGPRATRQQAQGPVPVPTPVVPRPVEMPPPALPENGHGMASEVAPDVPGGAMVVEEGRFGAPDAHLVSLMKPDCFESERYRSLRHVVEKRKREGVGFVLAVTSPTHNDGKTVTTLNLAGALAQESEARVLVIDADLRQPKVARYLRQKSVPAGLSDLVSDRQGPLADAIRYHRRYNLHVLAADGPAGAAPYEILKSERLGALLGETRRHFDYVVLDLPPMSYPDCQVLERNVDAVLLVVAADRTPRKLVESARDALDSEKFLGLVFNRDRERIGGYYYKTPNNRRGSWS